MSEVTIGSIWRESDRRFERYVKVVAIVGDKAEIETVDQRGAPLQMTFVTTKAKLSRFGKAYKRVAAAK